MKAFVAPHERRRPPAGAGPGRPRHRSRRVALLHYSPVPETLAGEPPRDLRLPGQLPAGRGHRPGRGGPRPARPRPPRQREGDDAGRHQGAQRRPAGVGRPVPRLRARRRRPAAQGVARRWSRRRRRQRPSRACSPRAGAAPDESLDGDGRDPDHHGVRPLPRADGHHRGPRRRGRAPSARRWAGPLGRSAWRSPSGANVRLISAIGGEAGVGPRPPHRRRGHRCTAACRRPPTPRRTCTTGDPAGARSWPRYDRWRLTRHELDALYEKALIEATRRRRLRPRRAPPGCDRARGHLRRLAADVGRVQPSASWPTSRATPSSRRCRRAPSRWSSSATRSWSAPSLASGDGRSELVAGIAASTRPGGPTCRHQGAKPPWRWSTDHWWRSWRLGSPPTTERGGGDSITAALAIGWPGATPSAMRSASGPPPVR